MKKNEGKLDRIIRVVLGIVLVIALFFVDGALKIILGVIGAVLLITGVLGFCGIYKLLGINTNKDGKK